VGRLNLDFASLHPGYRAVSATAFRRQAVDPFLAFIEDSALGEWIRGSESLFAFPAIITLHTIGMGFLAGGSAAIDLRILGFAPGISLKAMGRFLPLLWLAFAINAASGTLLLIAYPTKALTNPVFYVKLCLIALAVGLVYRIGNTVLRAPDVEQKPVARNVKALALASLAAWVALITAGRLLAYTHTWELLGVRAIT
jgi:hypothetical protein